MSIQKQFDVIIVGAGPGNSSIIVEPFTNFDWGKEGGRDYG